MVRTLIRAEPATNKKLGTWLQVQAHMKLARAAFVLAALAVMALGARRPR